MVDVAKVSMFVIFNWDDLLTFASRNNIKDATSVIDDVCEAASNWEGMAKDCGVPSAMIDAIIEAVR